MFACQSSARAVVKGASSARALGLGSKPAPSVAAQVPVALRQHPRREYHQGNGASRPSAARPRTLLAKAASQPPRSYPLQRHKQQLAAYSTGAPAANQPVIHDVFEKATGTWQYVVADPATSVAVIIDPVLDYDPVTQVITTTSADALLSLVREKGYKVDKILESHAHADHLTAASYLQSRLAEEQGSRPAICIGKRIGVIQALFSKRYGVPASEVEGVFDKLFDDDEEFAVGTLKGTAIHLPGHTPDHLGYRIGGKSRPHSLPISSRKMKLTSPQTTSSAATPSSPQTSAPPGATSPAAAPRTCTARAGACSACRSTSRSGRATTTRPPSGAVPWRPRACRSTGRATGTCATA